MVKTLLLGLILASVFCIIVNSTPVIHQIGSKHHHHDHQFHHQPQHHQQQGPQHNSTTTHTSAGSSASSGSDPGGGGAPFDDPGARSERSANLSHVTGASRKIKMYIKNRDLQLLPDGTVNGTTDDNSAYSILQRTTVGIGKVKVQGIATCQYLCMDSCGYLYGSRDFNEECILKEKMEKNHYNSYSSNKYSNANRTMYLALNRYGQQRKVILKTGHSIGRLTSYTRVLIRQADDFHLPPMRHNGHNLCPNVIYHQNANQQRKNVESLRCRKRRKRKKKKRRCPDEDFDPELCQKRHSVTNKSKVKTVNNKCDDENNNNNNKDSDECQREPTNTTTNKKKNKLNNSEKPLVSIQKKKKKIKKGARNKKQHQQQQQPEAELTSTEVTTPFIPTTQSTNFDDITPDIDYGPESSTHSDWEDSTALPDISMAVSNADTKDAPEEEAAQPHTDSD